MIADAVASCADDFETKVTRPVLKYMGGKWKIAPWVISHFPIHKCYVEPFGGSGGVLLRKHRSNIEVYNDRDDEIVNVFQVARDPVLSVELERLCNLTLYAQGEIAELHEYTSDPVERARRTICRSFFGLSSSSIFRHGNYICHSTGRNYAKHFSNYNRVFSSFHERLKTVLVENKPALDIITTFDSEDTLFYVDPPYVACTRNHGSYRYEMTDRDHQLLAIALRHAKGAVVVSGYPSELYDELYSGWRKEERSGRRNAGPLYGSTPSTECLWIKPRDDEGKIGMLPSLEI